MVSYPHPVVGKLDQIGLLFDLSDTPGVIQGRPLLVGEHTKEILARPGLHRRADQDHGRAVRHRLRRHAAHAAASARRAAAAAPKQGMAGMLQQEAKKG